MLDYWNRLTNIPDENLAKKALNENVNLRTNWIKTIEKLVRTINLLEAGNANKQFKKATKENIPNYYKTSWKNKLADPDLIRLCIMR